MESSDYFKRLDWTLATLLLEPTSIERRIKEDFGPICRK
jgi:hypothetical protein